MDDRNKGYNMTNDVLDLCSSDEENPGRQIEFLAQVIDLEITSTNPKVASRPQVVNLLDSDEDENDLDQKPAAKPRSRNLARKRARVSQGEIIDLESLSPQRDNKFPQPRNTGILTPPDFSNLVQVVPASPNRISSLDRVLEVFPDVDRNHAQKTLRDFNNHVEMVLSLLAEGSYPRSKHNTQKTAPFASINLAASVLVKRNKVHPKYDFMSRSSFEPSPIYIQEATKQLLHEFPFVSIHGMKALLQKQLNHYTIVRVEILNALKGSSTKAGATTEDNEVKQFQSLKIVWATKRPTPEQSNRIGPQYCVKRVIPRPIPVITDTILKEEIHYAKLQLEEWMQSMEQRIKRQEARKRSEKVGSGVECACCFDKVPIEEMVACRNEGHLFCADCIQNYADTQVFSNGSLGVVKATGKPSCELLCCDSSGCQSGFQEEHLQKALSLKTLEKYHELVFRAIIEAAGIQEEMWYVVISLGNKTHWN